MGRETVLNTCHHLNWVVLGGAIKHPDEGKRFDLSADTNKNAGIDDSSVFLYPVSGYGDAALIRRLIAEEKPDALMFISDPRYYEWLFAVENEVRRKIPIVYLTIWDSPFPQPLWNKPYYEACDMLMCISKQTANTVKVVLGDVPHVDIDKEEIS